MPEDTTQEGAPASLPRAFATTQWSAVLAVRDPNESVAREALERLCCTYWYPLYAYARRRGFSEADAQDSVQGFFAQMLERQSFQEPTPDRGRFRSFLLASFNYYLADVRDRNLAAKRGGGACAIALDTIHAEERYRFEPVDRLTPERIFERRWALTLVDNVLKRLEAEFADRAELFRQLRPVLFDKGAAVGFDRLAASLKMSAGAVRVALHRMRQRCRELFREEVAQTVEHPAEIEEELRYLRRLIGS